MVKIAPTLFIGLGTSGLAMINSVRELMFEEFLHAGFPSVRFLHITSQRGGEPYALSSEEFSEEYEKIKFCDISISQQEYDRVSMMINPQNTAFYKKGLAEWLTPDLTQLGKTSLENGMCGERKLGRMALWIKWSSVIETIRSEIGKVQVAKNRETTNDIIKKYHEQKNVHYEGNNNFVDDSINIFVCGTLLGGTCSGTFLDLAFYLSNTYQDAKVNGIFTLLDSELSAMPAYSRQAANAYAAMRELDYYTQDGTVYDYFIPDTMMPQTNRNPPFSHLSLITTKNTQGTRAPIISQDGTNDLESLHKMIGLSMFFGTVAGTDSELQSLRVDWRTDYFRPLQQPPRYLKNFTSFGAVALWYPKSRISGAAASQYIRDIISEKWLGDKKNTNLNIIEGEVNNILQRLVKKLRSDIISFLDEDGKSTTIEDHWRVYTNNIIEGMRQNHANIDDLRSTLLNQPMENPIAARFKNNGYYFQVMQSRQNLIINNFLADIQKQFTSLIKSSLRTVLDNNNRFTLSDVMQIASRLVEGLSNYAKNSPNLQNSDLTFEELEGNFEAFRIEQKRILTLIVGARERILSQHSQRIVEGIIFLLEQAQENLIKNFTAKIISDNLDHIQQLTNSTISDVCKKVDDIKALAVEKYKTFSAVRDYSSLKIVLRKPTFEEEVYYYVKRINASLVTAQLEEFVEMLLDQQHNKYMIFYEMLNFFQTTVLRDKEITDYKIIDSLNDSSMLIEYARNAEPMFEPAVKFQKIQYTENRYPTLIAGGDAKMRQMAKDIINPSMEYPFRREINLDLNHLIYLYKEEAGIAISEFEAFRHMEAQYNNGRHQFGCHMDKNPDRFDIERFLTMKEMIEGRWFKVSKELFENDIFNEIVENPEQGKYYKVTIDDEDGLQSSYYFFPDDENDFVNKMAETPVLFNEYKRRYTSLFVRYDRPAFRIKVNCLLETLVNKYGPESNNYKETDNFYREVIRVKYPQTNN